MENAVLLNSEVHEHHNNDPRNDLIAFDHKLYTIGFREGKIGLYRVTVEESFHDQKHANERVFHNLKYIEKVATVGGRFADFNLHGVSTSDDIATTYTVADLYRFVKKYDDDFSGAGKPNEAMLNEDCTPKVFYHGTDAEFTTFDRTKGRSTMDIQGMFFSPWELDAQGYGSNVGAYYLNIKNPAQERVAYRALNRFMGQNNAGVKARIYLESLGYDGVNNSDEEFIAFYPEQIKSATDNVGTFDAENPDTRYSRAAEDSEGEIARLTKENRKLEERVTQLNGQTVQTRNADGYNKGKISRRGDHGEKTVRRRGAFSLSNDGGGASSKATTEGTGGVYAAARIHSEIPVAGGEGRTSSVAAPIAGKEKSGRARSIDGYRRELEEARRRRRVGRLRLYYYRAKRVKELEDEYAKAMAAEK